MADDNEAQELELKRLCYRCVGESYLSRQIKTTGKRSKCSYCDKAGAAFLITELADRIDTAFQQHYVRMSEQPSPWEYASLSEDGFGSGWEPDGEPVLYAMANAAEIPELAARDIHEILKDKYWDYEATKLGEVTEFGAESYYEEKGPNDQAWQDEWLAFERTLKTEARIFSRSAEHHLASVFNDITTLKTRDGRPLVVNAGPDTALRALYRARVFESDDKLRDALARP
ncbi:MAG TPA: HEPN-associated N-terminal domain-containing protein, partial [Longimicrobium sp.]